MKKRITACMVLLVFAIAGAMAERYWGDGWAEALYAGTTKTLTLEEVYNGWWMYAASLNNLSNPQPFSGKLSKRQSRLMWNALNEYDYAPGEIYRVAIVEESAPARGFYMTVRIEADRSASWLCFTCDHL